MELKLFFHIIELVGVCKKRVAVVVRSGEIPFRSAERVHKPVLAHNVLRNAVLNIVFFIKKKRTLRRGKKSRGRGKGKRVGKVVFLYGNKQNKKRKEEPGEKKISGTIVSNLGKPKNAR